MVVVDMLFALVYHCCLFVMLQLEVSSFTPTDVLAYWGWGLALQFLRWPYRNLRKRLLSGPHWPVEKILVPVSAAFRIGRYRELVMLMLGEILLQLGGTASGWKAEAARGAGFVLAACDVIRCLQEGNADLNLANEDALTPWEIAGQSGHSTVQKVLKALGASVDDGAHEFDQLKGGGGT